MSRKPPFERKKFDLRKHQEKPAYRELVFLRDQVDEAARTVAVAWASEEPYERWWGTEILDCSTSSIRLGRLQNKAAVLFNHDRDQLIGVVETVSIGADRVGRSVLRFGKGAEADKHFRDVVDGILTKVSVGYMIHAMLLEKEEEGVPTYRITDWEPYEISMVTIPADDSVGLGRSAEEEGKTTEEEGKTTDEEGKTTEEEEGKSTDEEGKTTEEEGKTADEEGKTTEEEGKSGASDEEAKHLKISVTERKTMEVQTDIKRREALVEVGVKYADYLTMADVQRACTEGHSVQQLTELVIERQKTKHVDTSGAHIGLSAKEISQYSISRAVAAIVSGDWKNAGLERAASEAAAQRFGSGHSARTFSLPFDIMGKRDFTAGTANEAGNLIATDLRGDLFADVLRNRLALGNLGATMLFGLQSNIDIPRKTVGASVGFLSETGLAAETQINTGKVSLGPKRISTFVEFSKQAVIQSSMAVEPMLRQDIISELNVQAEYMAINGNGTAPNPRGIRNTSGIGSVVGGANGAQLTWAHLVDLESAVANVNAEPDVNSGYLINTRTRGATKRTQKATNLPFIWDGGDHPLNGYRAEVTNNMPNNLTKGTSNGVASSIVYSSMWDMLVLGFFGAVELTLDEITQAPNGMNRLILNAYMDVGCRRPANFAVMDDVLTA